MCGSTAFFDLCDPMVLFLYQFRAVFTDGSENRAPPQQDHHLPLDAVWIWQVLLSLYEDIVTKTCS